MRRCPCSKLTGSRSKGASSSRRSRTPPTGSSCASIASPSASPPRPPAGSRRSPTGTTRASATRLLEVDVNYSGQHVAIVRERTCLPIEQLVVKYNGRPMSSEEIYDALKMIHEGKAPKKLVLKRGA